MKEIHKIIAVAIRDNKFFMVKKKGYDVWTSLGGKPELGETEEQALMREIDEEIHCQAEIIYKIGDFTAVAAHDSDAMVRLSAYLVDLKDEVKLDDPELEQCAFLSEDYKKLGIRLPDSIEEQILPYCVKNKLLSW